MIQEIAVGGKGDFFRSDLALWWVQAKRLVFFQSGDRTVRKDFGPGALCDALQTVCVFTWIDGNTNRNGQCAVKWPRQAMGA